MESLTPHNYESPVYLQKEVLSQNPIKETKVGGVVVGEVVSFTADDHQSIVSHETSNVSREQDRRFGRVMERMDQNQESTKELGMRTREVMISDGHHLENQEVNFIDARDEGYIVANFKLTKDQYDQVVDRLKTSDTTFADSELVYKRFGEKQDTRDADSFHVSGAYRVDHKNLVIKVADGSIEGYEGKPEAVRTALGLVTIEIPYTNEQQPTAEEIEDSVNEALVTILGVADGLSEPTQEAERQYKMARFRWHNKIDGPLTPQQVSEVEHYTRQEVFPGYYTMVSKDKHLKYESEYGEFALYHEVSRSGFNQIISILKNGGLMSSHERFRRGLLINGASTTEDFKTGGADSVFTRTITNTPPNWTKQRNPNDDYAFVLGPELYDRTDWYAYQSDEYGSTANETFHKRLSPGEVFERQKKNGFGPWNEQMFRTGIDSSHLKAIACPDQPVVKEEIARALELDEEEITKLWEAGPNAIRAELTRKNISKVGYQEQPAEEVLSQDSRLILIDKLHEAGINEINGVPVEQFAVSVRNVDDYIDISHGRPPRSSLEPLIDSDAPEYDDGMPAPSQKAVFLDSLGYTPPTTNNEDDNSFEQFPKEYTTKKYGDYNDYSEEEEYDDYYL